MARSKPTEPKADKTAEALTEAPETEPDPESISLLIGDPFALTGSGGDQNAVFLPRDDQQGVPGCFASVLCGCGQPFKINLLEDAPTRCASCEQRYTTVLVVAAVDDPWIVHYMNRYLLESNGIELPPLEDEPDEE